MPMTPRERTLTAMNHEEPDRVPIFIGASNATGIQMKPYKQLKKIIRVETENHYLYNWPELGTARIDEKTLQRLSSDVRGVWDVHPTSTIEKNRNRKPGEPFFDSWGIGQIEITPEVWFPGIHPLNDATTVSELDYYAGWPDMDDPSRVAHVKAHASQLSAEACYGVMGTPWLLFPFERAIQMQGMEKFFINLVENPDFAQDLLRRCAEHCKTLMGHFLHEAGEYLDIIKIGDDLGTSANLLISPKMYRKMLKPIHADYIAFIKERTHAKIFFHTDGDVSPLIKDFIEIGVDILNPIQTSAGKMGDLADLKKLYGKHLVFCGAIDTSQVLPFGTPDDVRREVRRVIQALGAGGGYLLAAVHTIQKDVPPENILAMVDAAREFGTYPID